MADSIKATNLTRLLGDEGGDFTDSFLKTVSGGGGPQQRQDADDLPAVSPKAYISAGLVALSSMDGNEIKKIGAAALKEKDQAASHLYAGTLAQAPIFIHAFRQGEKDGDRGEGDAVPKSDAEILSANASHIKKGVNWLAAKVKIAAAQDLSGTSPGGDVGAQLYNEVFDKVCKLIGQAGPKEEKIKSTAVPKTIKELFGKKRGGWQARVKKGNEELTAAQKAELTVRVGVDEETHRREVEALRQKEAVQKKEVQEAERIRREKWGSGAGDSGRIAGRKRRADGSALTEQELAAQEVGSDPSCYDDLLKIEL